MLYRVVGRLSDYDEGQLHPLVYFFPSPDGRYTFEVSYTRTLTIVTNFTLSSANQLSVQVTPTPVMSSHETFFPFLLAI